MNGSASVRGFKFQKKYSLLLILEAIDKKTLEQAFLEPNENLPCGKEIDLMLLTNEQGVNYRKYYEFKDRDATDDEFFSSLLVLRDLLRRRVAGPQQLKLFYCYSGREKLSRSIADWLRDAENRNRGWKGQTAQIGEFLNKWCASQKSKAVQDSISKSNGFANLVNTAIDDGRLILETKSVISDTTTSVQPTDPKNPNPVNYGDLFGRLETIVTSISRKIVERKINDGEAEGILFELLEVVERTASHDKEICKVGEDKDKDEDRGQLDLQLLMSIFIKHLMRGIERDDPTEGSELRAKHQLRVSHHFNIAMESQELIDAMGRG